MTNEIGPICLWLPSAYRPHSSNETPKKSQLCCKVIFAAVFYKIFASYVEVLQTQSVGTYQRPTIGDRADKSRQVRLLLTSRGRMQVEPKGLMEKMH